MYGAAHVELALTCACRFLLIFGLGRELRYYQFGHSSLEFHIVGSGFAGFGHHALRQCEVAVVVHAGLGYDYYMIVLVHFCSG